MAQQFSYDTPRRLEFVGRSVALEEAMLQLQEYLPNERKRQQEYRAELAKGQSAKLERQTFLYAKNVSMVSLLLFVVDRKVQEVAAAAEKTAKYIERYKHKFDDLSLVVWKLDVTGAYEIIARANTLNAAVSNERLFEGETLQVMAKSLQKAYWLAPSAVNPDLFPFGG